MLVTLRKSQFLFINRKISTMKKIIFEDMKKSNIGTSKIVSHLEVMSGGCGKTGCIDMDIRSYERDERNDIKDFDTQMILEHFSHL